MPTVPTRVLRKVLLMVILRKIVLTGRRNLGGDRAESGGGQAGLVRVPRPFGSHPLLVRVVIDGRPVLCSNVTALPHALRRIVSFPELLQHGVVRRDRRIEYDA